MHDGTVQEQYPLFFIGMYPDPATKKRNLAKRKDEVSN